MKKHDFYLNLVDKKGRESLFREITNIKEFISMKLTMMELLMYRSTDRGRAGDSVNRV